MTIAIVFPGQGAAVPHIGRTWRDHPAYRVVSEAEQACGVKLEYLLTEATEHDLATTFNSQLAVLLTSLIAWRALHEQTQCTPVAFAGHSLGQITALIAAQCLSPTDGYRLALARAQACQASADRKQGRMLALAGADQTQATALCSAVDNVWLANDNAPGQIVIAGSAAGIARAANLAPSFEIRRTIPLAVGHAFHTPLLADAAFALANTLHTTAFADTHEPVVANTDAKPHWHGTDWPDALTTHLTTPVRWTESQRTLQRLGATTIIEVGPGKVLAGLARRTVPDMHVLNLSTPDDLPNVINHVASLDLAVAS